MAGRLALIIDFGPGVRPIAVQIAAQGRTAHPVAIVRWQAQADAILMLDSEHKSVQKLFDRPEITRAYERLRWNIMRGCSVQEEATNGG